MPHSKARYAENREREIARTRDWQKRNPEKVRAAVRAWNAKNRDKRRAQGRLQYAVKTGKLVRPDGCEQCGKRCKPHGHHPDHSLPLVVQWLCASCHRRITS